MAQLAAYEAVEVLENEHTRRFLPGTVEACLHRALLAHPACYTSAAANPVVQKTYS
jgi:hypothetical protein